MDYLSNLIILSIIIYISGISFFILGIILSKKTKTSTTLNDASIIVCVKNGENSLQNILEDLRKQIYSSNIEFIIVDDASVDKSKYIIQEYAMNFLDFQKPLKFLSLKMTLFPIQHRE